MDRCSGERKRKGELGLRDNQEYWEREWQSDTKEAYQSYLLGHMRAKPWFLDAFKSHGFSCVCDAACGFGAYSAMLSANGYQISGFDVSQTAVSITTELLYRNQLAFEQYRVCDICAIDFADGVFDAVIAHAVLDHLETRSVQKAISELFRITKHKGLVYISFDPLEQDDLDEAHEVLSDGSFVYQSGNRDGLLFHYYTDEEIRTLLKEKSVLQWNQNKRGERELLLIKD